MTLEGFRPSSYLTSQTARILETVGNGKAIAAVSGGVDSTVAALVAKRALGDRLLPVFIDTGFLRVGEAESIKTRLGDSSLVLKVKLVKAGGPFLEAKKGETRAEEKRKKLPATFYRVLGEEAQKDGCDF